MDEAWAAVAREAWDSLERDAIRRRRRGMKVLDGPGGRAAPLWPYTQVLWAAAEVAAVGGDPPTEELVAGLHRFASGDGFAATPRGRRYFDDNAWLGLASARLAEVAGGADDRARADSLAAFVRTGEHPDGGVLWVEGGTTRNTCSTASAAWLSTEFPAEAEDHDAVDFATRSLDWLDSTLRGPDDLYGDHVRADGSVVAKRWSYNQGAAVAAAAGLGRDPTATARAALDRYRGELLWHEAQAFAVILFRALLREPAIASAASEVLADHTARLLERARDRTGWFTNADLGTYGDAPTIDQAAVVQLLAFRALA